MIAGKLAAGGTEAITPLPLFSDPSYAVGFVDLPKDSDQVIRSSQLDRPSTGEDTQYSFATHLAEGYLTAQNNQAEYLTPVDEKTRALGDGICRCVTIVLCR